MKIDFHAHLPEKHVPAETLFASVPAGTQIFVCATSANDCEYLRELQAFARERGIALEVAFGLHPWFVKKDFHSEIAKIERALIAVPDAQVGEIGLDKCKPNFEFQLQAFEEQLRLAGAHNRRATIHCVRAWNELFEILKKPEFQTVDLHFHRFSGTPEIAQQLLKRRGNVIFSFLEKDLNTPSEKLKKILAVVPANCVFPESDAPIQSNPNFCL